MIKVRICTGYCLLSAKQRDTSGVCFVRCRISVGLIVVFKWPVHAYEPSYPRYSPEWDSSVLVIFFIRKIVYVYIGNEPAQLGEIPPWARWDLSEVGWKFSYELAIPPDRDGHYFALFTYIAVRHRICQDVRSKLNINKLRLILKVVMPCQMITANTTRKSFEGAMFVCLFVCLFVCYCANFVPVHEAGWKQPRIRPTQVGSPASRPHTNRP